MLVDVTIAWTTGHYTSFRVWGTVRDAIARTVKEVRRESNLLYAGKVRHPLSVTVVWKDGEVECGEVLTGGIGLLEAVLTVPEGEE